MNRIDMEHQIYKQNLSNSTIKSEIKINSPKNRHFLAATTSSLKNSPQKTYVKWILNTTQIKFYLMPLQNDGIIALVKHDFNSLVGLRFCDTLTPKTKSIFNKQYSHAVEVVSLHSFKKGEGADIIRELDNLMLQLQIPLVLYTEKIELVGYYEGLGFENYGTHGANKEYLMIKFPN
jgi:hypothetical protein